jgi:hypothetical protein
MVGSTGFKDETQTHCFTGFSRMVSLVIPNVGFASLLTAATLLMALQGLVCPVEVERLKHSCGPMNSLDVANLGALSMPLVVKTCLLD